MNKGSTKRLRSIRACTSLGPLREPDSSESSIAQLPVTRIGAPGHRVRSVSRLRRADTRQCELCTSLSWPCLRDEGKKDGENPGTALYTKRQHFRGVDPELATFMRVAQKALHPVRAPFALSSANANPGGIDSAMVVCERWFARICCVKTSA